MDAFRQLLKCTAVRAMTGSMRNNFVARRARLLRNIFTAFLGFLTREIYLTGYLIQEEIE
jgi:hypothetical protein